MGAQIHAAEYSTLRLSLLVHSRPCHPPPNQRLKIMPVHLTEDGLYKLFPSPRNRHRSIFEHRVFVPRPYMLIDLESLFAACRLTDMKMGQLVTLETADDEARFNDRFIPD
jgi:hypothetical protein